ncbi:hypothetical protein F3I54_01335 [Pantoea sp. VH_18]|uniref:Lipoprotein n=2 Tax=Erwiniaceae TaxID=1903409 RepID=A0AB34CSA6_9GAMM|nr:hypothetical protein F3I55_00855 [Pantoea sp. VH_24]KAA5964641.1 hypothetical protein F3I53_01180 [Pantoea sp. VH_16]KAA5968817.1 hypothetical protein F3I54_01335 [Pantoea sp. VH_18]KAA6004579.1 hypothetical protein F3I46_00490 [Pantoea sp. M_1]KAA6007075.1 hypothetical protein F3I45_01155 [Pantoea sp. F_7]KAA6015890.1 hypothetical protein F3I43_01155 [Pantoea sp. F_18]KAA6018123.1 hypothetical protein F3I44_01155 [Pantoea sp. F_5]KAA6020416.1 hypothetical protein F3I40_01155 [Pantoea sp.
MLSTILMSGCGPAKLNDSEKKLVDNLKVELSKTEKDIELSLSESQQYSQGLIRNLITSKKEILEINKALLQQRINALEAGAKIDFETKGTKTDPALADKISNEMGSLITKIDSDKADSGNYTGLVQTIKLATIASEEQTLAMLQQKYLAAKYGMMTIQISETSGKSHSPSSSPVVSDKNSKDNLLPPADGPFGLQEGLTKKNIEDMTGVNLSPIEGSTNLYLAEALPKSNNDFSTFALLISPQVGLCQIRAVGKDIDSDSYGIALQIKFNELKKSLDSIYGNGKKIDIVLPGSIWKEPEYWMMGVAKKERTLAAEWTSKNDAMKKNRLSDVNIESRADSDSKGYIFLQYTFENGTQCQNELDNANKGSL